MTTAVVELSLRRRLLLAVVTTGALVVPADLQPTRAQETRPDEEDRPYPVLATEATRADPAALARLEEPGVVLFRDDYESPDSLGHYFEIQGSNDGRARLTTDPRLAHAGSGAFQFTAPANDGKSSGAAAHFWFGPAGHDRIHLRYYLKFAADYDQGNLHHTGGGLAGAAGSNKWAGMGSAGLRPRGDDHFSTRFEPWRDWGRFPPPGFPILYTYWMDMKRDRDGNFWGNNLGPATNERIALERDRWYCFEVRIQVNEVGKADGELAAWIDGRLYVHYTGLRWRSDAAVRLKRFGIGVYVHHATKDNTVWYDDVVLLTGYVGPAR